MAITALCVVAASLLALTEAVVIRVCVPESAMGPCGRMVTEPALANFTLQCVSGPDRYGCLNKVVAKAADVMTASGEDVFLARDLYDQLQIVAETRDRDRRTQAWRYQGVAVVRRNKIKRLEDLRGSKSCHTGYARTAGWNIPFSQLLDKKLIALQCATQATVVEHDIKAAAAFFGPACLPGKWAPDNETDTMLKTKYSSLCAMCGLPEVCGHEDPHAGYAGALTCLVDGKGDVAWSKMSAVLDFFKGRSEVVLADYGLLCPDNRVLEVAESPKQCRWASRPWNGWLVRSANENKKAILAALTMMVNTAAPPKEKVRAWAASVLNVGSKPTVIHPRSPPVSTRDYLKEHKYDTTIERLGCREEAIKLCVDSEIAVEKCQALRHVMRSRRIRPALECVTPTRGTCITMVADGAAHITTADGGDVYHAYVEHKIVPVVSERYGFLDASYFAVAVVRADSGITSLSQLRGKKSCHTGIGKTAGWKIPVVTLKEAGLLEEGKDQTCDFPGQMGRFFSSSCAPGAKSPKYDPSGTNPDSLCNLCVGNKKNGIAGKCDRGPTEAFSGYTGAFRCLVEGGGDVAFIKHTTVRDNSNGNNNASWAANLRAVDYKLLCRPNGTADVVEYNTCHLAQVPAHKVLINPNLTLIMKEEARIMLLRMSEWFPKGQDTFHMFGTFKGIQDLIFKDSATGLVNVRVDAFHQSLEDAYFRTLQKIDACKPIGTTMPFTKDADNGATTLSLASTHLMCVVIAWFLAH